MNWVGEIDEKGSEMRVYDHEGSLIDTLSNDGSGFSKQDVQNVAFDAMQGSRPSAYNQAMIACMATNQIKIVRSE